MFDELWVSRGEYGSVVRGTGLPGALPQLLRTPGLVGAYFPYMDVVGRNVLGTGAEAFPLSGGSRWYTYCGYFGGSGCPTVTVTAQGDGTYRLTAPIAEGAPSDIRLLYAYYALANVPYQLSLWAKANAGNPKIRLFDIEPSLTSTWTQYTNSYTNTGGATRFIYIYAGSGEALDVTVGFPQLNLGSTLYPYSAPVGLSQSVVDRSGLGNTIQRGSTSGADANDPSWEANALLYDSDDIAYSPVISSMSHSSGWSVFLALTATGMDTHLGVGNLSPDWQPHVSVERWGPSGSLRVFSGSSEKTNSIPTNAFKTGQPCLIYLKYSGGISYFRSMDTADITEIEHTLSNRTPQVVFNARAYNGGINRASSSRQYLCLAFNRVTTSAEDERIYASVKKLLAGQGVTLS